MNSEFLDEGMKLAEEVLEIAQRKGADDVAVIYEDWIGRHFRFSQSRVDISNSWLYNKLSLCVGKEKRVLVAETQDLRPDRLKKFVEDSIDAVKHLPPREIYEPLPEGPFDYPIVPDLYDQRLLTAEEKLVDAAKIAIDSALLEGAERVAGAIKSGAGYSCLVTSGGVAVCSRESKVHLEVRAFAGEGSGHGTTCSRFLDGIDAVRAGEEAGRDASLSKDLFKVQEGKYDAVFGRSALGNLVDVFGQMASGLYILMRMSPYTNKLNQKIASETVTLIDDPLMPGGFGSRAYDDEGFPTKRNVIIEKGVLKTYLHNRLTAKAFSARSTGNAGWIVPRPWNLVLLPGDFGEEEIVQEVRRGLVVKNVTYLRFQNYLTGDFSAVIRDGVFLVENGEIKAAVKGLRLSDNLLKLLSNLYSASKRAVPVYHWWMEWKIPVVTPLVAIREVRFTSATV